MKAIRDGGNADVSEWNLDVFAEAEQAFKGALLQIVKDGVNEALECALLEEAPIVFQSDGIFKLFVPLNSYALTTEPSFKFDLVANVAEEISYLQNGPDEDQIANLKRIRETLRKAIGLLDGFFEKEEAEAN